MRNYVQLLYIWQGRALSLNISFLFQFRRVSRGKAYKNLLNTIEIILKIKICTAGTERRGAER